MKELVKFYRGSYHRDFYIYEEKAYDNSIYYRIICKEFKGTSNYRKFEFLLDNIPTDDYLENYKEEKN